MEQKRRNVISIAITFGLVLTVFIFPNASPNHDPKRPQTITDYFQIIAAKTKPRPNDSVILASDLNKRFVITVKDFVEYKAHMQFLYDIQGIKGFLRNEALLEEMIKSELLAAEAVANGLNISEGELQDYIAQQREALKSAPLEMKEIEMNLIRLSGLSEDAYWQSEKTLKNYERFLLINKLTEHLNLKTKKEYCRHSRNLT